MDNVLTEIFADGAALQVVALLGAALFFLTVGLLELRGERPEGFLYLALALFFVTAHTACLINLPAHLEAVGISVEFTLWTWLALLLAPGLIAIFVLRSLFDFVFSRSQEGLLKLFFGLTLLCFLYMLGAEWPMDVRGIMTLVWLSMFFKLEMGTIYD